MKHNDGDLIAWVRWPNGQGVGLRSRRFQVQVLGGSHELGLRTARLLQGSSNSIGAQMFAMVAEMGARVRRNGGTRRGGEDTKPDFARVRLWDARGALVPWQGAVHNKSAMKP